MSENFTYHYSAERQSEIDAIRKKYLPPEEQESKVFVILNWNVSHVMSQMGGISDSSRSVSRSQGVSPYCSPPKA